MWEEQFLVACGCPPEDAVTMCHSIRREGMMDEFMAEIESARFNNCDCKYGCNHVCAECPCRNK